MDFTFEPDLHSMFPDIASALSIVGERRDFAPAVALNSGLWHFLSTGAANTGHDGARRLGGQLAEQGVPEDFLHRLLDGSQADFDHATRDLIAEFRSANRPLNWVDLGALFVSRQRRSAQLEAVQTQIAACYFYKKGGY